MKKRISILFAILVSISGVSAKIYNIRDYGAKNNKTIVSTSAIQQTIDACAKDGGGTVVVPAGEYLSATLFLRSNVNFNLETGATIYASQNKADYEGKSMKHGAADAQSVNVLIAAFDCENIKISGKGRLHGQGVREQYTREAEFDPTELITGREIANAAKYGADYRTKYRRVAPSPGLINLTNCHDVTVEDIQLIESGFWTFHVQWCSRVFIRGIYITSSSDNGVNSDGLDIDGSSQVLVSDCIIDTGDDALCLKTSKNEGKSMSCEDIVITNCILRSSSAALKIGTESHSDFSRITVSNCVINGANRGLNMIIRDGGNVSDVHFSNIIIKTERKRCFWWGNGDPIWLIVANRTPQSKTGSIKNVSFDNISARSQSGVRLEGYNSAMEDIRFNNVNLYMEPENAIDKRSKHAFHFMNIKNLTLNECSVKWDEQKPEPTWQKAFNFEKIENLYLDKIKANPAPDQTEAMSFDQISGEFVHRGYISNK
ncbi:glycosyl hydrolase family 28 [Dysgonomonas alginatilytica]|uniref:Glycosyl hydrolase family 28 n=1 Tax=Dysgonomonas alginatilytica TaxID=1605892 RepID=A0A2V3PIM8_9BACT|nr:glycoside hydrolase family 28 protein [Dysgonomonas alginatilytica]PXV59950.1 glycosyl hydrolase family 28 [Dysgonomonas alginatilytica]